MNFGEVCRAMRVAASKPASPDRHRLRGWLGLLLLLALGLPGPATRTACAQQADGASLHIELEDGLLSAEIRDTPLPQVLTEIGRLAGFKVVRVADFDDFPRINSGFDRLPLQQAIKRLVADSNSITIFSADTGTDSERSISQLWLLGPGEDGAANTQHSEVAGELQHEDPLIRSQAALRMVQQQGEEAVLEKLTVLLQKDDDPLVRSRVAIALGSLDDERAVPELESALQDRNFTVRAQSISALGRIGGDRATAALGGILADVNANSLERVMAAQALWKQDTELARGFLRAGRADSDARVREASSRAPSAPARVAGDALAGPEVGE